MNGAVRCDTVQLMLFIFLSSFFLCRLVIFVFLLLFSFLMWMYYSFIFFIGVLFYFSYFCFKQTIPILYPAVFFLWRTFGRLVGWVCAFMTIQSRRDRPQFCSHCAVIKAATYYTYTHTHTYLHTGKTDTSPQHKFFVVTKRRKHIYLVSTGLQSVLLQPTKSKQKLSISQFLLSEIFYLHNWYSLLWPGPKMDGVIFSRLNRHIPIKRDHAGIPSTLPFST